MAEAGDYSFAWCFLSSSTIKVSLDIEQPPVVQGRGSGSLTQTASRLSRGGKERATELWPKLGSTLSPRAAVGRRGAVGNLVDSRGATF